MDQLQWHSYCILELPTGAIIKFFKKSELSSVFVINYKWYSYATDVNAIFSSKKFVNSFYSNGHIEINTTCELQTNRLICLGVIRKYRS